jgi:tRNA (guanine37-N1)-methyltransferase
MRFDIITIFPEFFGGIFGHGVVKRAIANGLVEIGLRDLRDFTHDRHRTVDDRPFGGGEGMVLKPEPLIEAVESLGIAPKQDRDPARESVVLLSAQGAKFTQAVARELSALERVVLICGRYEGVDERVNELACDRELSIGDYVLSGGELAAAVIVDATMRLLPGVLGNEYSAA